MFRFYNKRRPKTTSTASIAPELVEDLQFDADFYVQHYKDVASSVGLAGAKRHFVNDGYSEGRVSNAAQLIRGLERQYGDLPTDFLPNIYQMLHNDLHGIKNDWEISAHYLQFGRFEKRPYRVENEKYESLYLIHASKNPNFEIKNSGTQRPNDFAGILLRHKLVPGKWLDAFNINDFVFLNAGWLDTQPRSRLDAILTFVEHGVSRFAPISSRLTFDPKFYRSVVPDIRSNISDVDLYRSWLNKASYVSHPGNEAEFLRRLLGSSSFPSCFDAHAYAKIFKIDAASRSKLLARFFDSGDISKSETFISGPGAADLYEQLGDYHLQRGKCAAAKEAFDRSLKLEPTRGRCRHKRGDALMALGRHRDAVMDYQAAADEPNAGIWSHIHAANGLATILEQPAAAVERLLLSAPKCRSSPQWRAVAHRIVGQFFEKECANARVFYAAGRRAEGDKRILACVTRVEAIIKAIDPLPSRLPIPQDGPVVIIANRDLPQCDHYRVVQKYGLLMDGGWEADVFDQHHGEAFRPALDRARLVIFYRVAATPAILHALLYVKALGVPTLYEIDDLIFDGDVYPDPFDSFEGQIEPAEYACLQQGVPLFRHAMQLCDAGLASTPALAEAMRPLVRTGICHLLRNGLDKRNAPFLASPWSPFSPDAITIFYGSGTKAHNRDFTDFAAPALIDVMGRHPNVRLVVAGYLQLDPRFDPFVARVRRLDLTADLTSYWEVLSGADISLAVLTPSATTDAKSEIKWLEAAMCAVPSVVSPTRTYREVLRDGEDVLFADTPEAWTAALERFVVDAPFRRRVGERARERAVAEYAPEAAIEAMATFLPPRSAMARARSQLMSAKPPASGRLETGSEHGAASPTQGRRKRILFVNVYFPPQIHGGATRVMRDNVDFLVEAASDRFEYAVVASDDGVEPPYRTRIDAYGDVPVYRISSPRAAHMDWRPFDPSMTEPFERIMERFAPDLVHFHCIQRLTGSVVETVKAFGVPYVVTLHDAWWISDFQFLITPDGQPQAPGPDSLTQTTDDAHDPIVSIARRRRLARLLDGAEALVAVSEAFASVYRRAGFANVIAIPNGVSSFTPLPRTPSPTGRVRLGHIGNRSDHKGANLVEAALRASTFANLSLTMVDYALSADTVCEEIWGTTPVRLVGPTPQEKIAELYAELDVLMAPSLWPESFGLVTREARAAGLWVIASDRGAIGEDIVDGVDGFRIDVSNLDGLRRALSTIDANPDRYLTSPPSPEGMIRTNRDQGRELVDLYDDILGPDGNTRPSRLG